MTSYEAELVDVVVVDNQSDDGTPEYVRDSFPWAQLVESGGNLGFGRGCNLGFTRASTPYTLFLNPDATLSKDALQTLLAFMDSHPSVGMCAPAIREANGELQVAGVLPTPMSIVRHAAGLSGYPSMREIEPGGAPFRTNWLCGAVLLVRSDVFARVGGFDPRFFLYFEETDLCRKVMDEGYELWAVGEALADHECGASTKQSGNTMAHQCISEHYYRSRFYYLIKHHGWAAAAMAEVATIPLLGARSLLKRVVGRSDDGAFAERISAPILKLPDRIEVD
jgi:N-acetylglucosaminyl-diphospho-decaprenol L-rhamnosyltransferase